MKTKTIKTNSALFALLIFPSLAFSLDNDKQLHIGTSAIISSGTYFMHQGITDNFDERASSSASSMVSMSACLSAGIIKEVYDNIHGSGFDEKDMAANAVGCSIGTYLAHSFNSSLILTPTISEEGNYSGLTITKLF